MTSEPGSMTTPAAPSVNQQLRLPRQRRKAEAAAGRSWGNPASWSLSPNGSSQLRKRRLHGPREVLAPTTTKTAVLSKLTIAANVPTMRETEGTRRIKTEMMAVVARAAVVADVVVIVPATAANAPSEPVLRHLAHLHRLALLHQDVIAASAHAVLRIADLPTETASLIEVPRLADVTPVHLNSHPLNPVADAATVAV